MRLSKYLVRLLFVVTLLATGVPAAGWAKDILTVEANGVVRNYTAEDLLSLPQTEVRTKNDYVDQKTTFSGPSLKLILQQNGIGPDAKIKLDALNDFSNVLPASDAYKYNVIVAILMNGKRMSVREKGPLWVIYPMDDNPELKGDLYNGRLVWQLRKITLQ